MKLLPVILAAVGLAGGGAAGFFLRPDPVAEDAHAADLAECPAPAEGHEAVAHDDGQVGVAGTEFVNFENQFVVPVTAADSIVSLVVLSITLEVGEGKSNQIYTQLPKLRDAFLGVLFDHSSAGGFSSDFVNGRGLETLRGMLRETAIGTSGTAVKNVLIVDLVKQDV